MIHKSLPPPLPFRFYLAAAARKRGISSTIIAKQMGISHQRVFQMLDRYETYHGPIGRNDAPKVKINSTGRVKSSFVCRGCAAAGWYRPRTEKTGQFCSVACRGLFERVLSHAEIAHCIESRKNGETWTGLQNRMDVPFQTIQKNIWYFLIESGDLMLAKVEAIWGPSGRWDWLVNSVGQKPAR